MIKPYSIRVDGVGGGPATPPRLLFCPSAHQPPKTSGKSLEVPHRLMARAVAGNVNGPNATWLGRLYGPFYLDHAVSCALGCGAAKTRGFAGCHYADGNRLPTAKAASDKLDKRSGSATLGSRHHILPIWHVRACSITCWGDLRDQR